MAEMQISIRNSAGARVPDLSEIELTGVDTLTFTVDSDADVIVRFSKEAAGILSPSPGQAVNLSGGATASFQVAAAPPGRYGVALQIPMDSRIESATSDMTGTAPVLVIRRSRTPDFGGPEPVTESGDAGR